MKRPVSFLISLAIFLLSAVAASAERASIRILHINDFHGFAEPYKPFNSEEKLGGIAYLASEAERLCREKPCMLVSAGDMIQGSNWANLFQGKSVIELMNMMKFDAMVLGNHEFDFGQDVLRTRVAEAVFPILGANVEGMEGVRPYVIKEVGGVKIGLIGVVTEDVPVSTHPRNVQGLRFVRPDEAVEKYLPKMKEEACSVIVLSHIGYSSDRELAVKVKGISAIIGGHSHTKVSEPIMTGGALVVQAWEHAKALGVVDLTVDDGCIVQAEGRLVDISPASGNPDASAASVVEKYRLKVDAVLDDVIGEAVRDLDGENVRRQETNLGDLIADIIRTTAGADAAIIGGGSIRTSIKKGIIRVKHVYSVSPFNNYIVAVRLTGGQILEALEHGVSAIEDGAGRFPQVSGISYVLDTSAKPGSRVSGVRVGGVPLDLSKEYVVATDDFLAAGGDGYRAFGDAVRSSKDYDVVGGMMKGEKLVYSNSGRWVRDVVVDYIREKKKISQKTEDRITVKRNSP